MTAKSQDPELSPSAKRALLARLLAERAARRDADDRPLSFAQERLWFFDQLVPGSPAYNLHTGIRLRGALDADLLERSLQEIVRRHDALRATFPTVGGAPVQRIATQAAVPLERIDLTGSAEPEDEARRLGQQDAARPFDLATGPLLRLTLLRLAPADHLLLVAMHHIVSDGWSLGVVMRELAAVYGAFSRGLPSPLPPLPVQFPEFARAQREAMSGPRLQEQLAYWKGHLAGAPDALELGTDRPRPPSQSFRGGTVGALVPRELVERLRVFARAEGATLFMAMLAAFEALLARRSGQEDFVVGTPVSGRTGSDTEPMIGCFINTLVLRADLSGSPTVRSLLSRVRDAALGGFAHADAPFERLVEELQPSRDLSRNPLYQVMFNLVALGSAPAAPPDGPALQIVHLADEPAKLDLSLYAIEEADGIRLRLVYARDLFDHETAVELLAQYEQLLDLMTGDLEARVADIPLVTPSARQVLPDPGAALPAPAIEPVTATVAARAAARPDHPALVRDGEVCTYGELAGRMERIAQALAARGVTAGDVVAITGAPDAGLLAGVLGIMRARGVLLLLDPRLPGERRRLMAREAGARHLLIAGADADPLATAAELDVASWSTVDDVADGPSATLPSVSPPVPEDPAYVFFTSGTTGVPKAVVGVHTGLAHFVRWQRETFDVGPADRVAQLTGLSFDVVLREIFLPLTSGASLCLRPAGAADDLAGDRVLPWLERQRVTTIHTVPTLAQAWLAAVPDGVSLPDLRRVFFAGEPLSGTLVRRWRAAFPSATSLINLYGPTETTLAKCVYRVPDDPGDAVQPVGRALPDTQALVVTPGLSLCGIGECGEIAIRTPYRTLGYRNAAEEQRKRFVRNPWRDDPDDLIYLTGDRGRYRRDGILEILGRVDDQVKIRGVRVEPGEIAAALLRHPHVAQAAVVVRGGDPADKRLVAYAVPAEGAAPSAGELRAFLEARLPDALVPSAFVLLPALPMTANGKLDRRRLPEPTVEDQVADAARVQARNPIEEEIAGAWADLTGRPPRSVHESFFEAGGHSLQATQLVSRLRSMFRVDLPLRAFYQEPTVAGLGSAIAASLGDAAPPADPISRADGASSPASSAQQRVWFFEQANPGTSLYVVNAAARLRGALDAAALERALADVVARHEALRTTFALIDGVLVQQVGEARFALEREDLREVDLASRESECVRRAAAFAAMPFALSEGPLFRARLIQLGADDHLLVLAMHHIVSDVWSLGVLSTEIAALYDAHRDGRTPRLPDLPVQYRDFTAWLRRRMDDGSLAGQVSYWKGQLAGDLPALELPTDRPRPAVMTNRGARVPFTWSRELTSALKRLSQGSGVTLFTTLAAAYAVMLSRHGRQDEVLIGFPIAGRAHAEVEPLIGFFVNTLVLRADLTGDPTVRGLLARLHAAALGAYAHQDVPFDRLVEELRPPRQANRHPIFQAVLALHNTPLPPLRLAGVEVEPVSLDVDRSRFDLTVSMWEHDQRLSGFVEYSTDLFDPPTVGRLARHLEQAATALAAAPDARVATIGIVDGDERRLMVECWNETETPYPREASLHTLFAASAGARGDAIAVEYEDATLTYAELDRRSNQLARHLLALGVGPDNLVGLAVQRSAAMVVGMLGIIKAGGAYVPLDPAYPADRLALMAEDAGLRVIVHHAGLEGVPRRAGSVLVAIDQDWPAIAAHPDDDLPVETSGDHLAYVIYTSGSTGRPKGVGIPHRGVARLLINPLYIDIDAADRVAQISNSSFDAATFEIWGALLHGARLVGISRETALSPKGLADAFATHGITTALLTTALFNTHAREIPAAFSRMRNLVFGGEAADPVAVRRILADGPERLINLYGPTESTVVATWHPIEALDASATSVPIGRPIANTRVYVLDPRLNLVPPGVDGELHIAGDGLARGYVNRPDATAERFLPDPFAATPGARMYATGDLVRWTPEGQLVFVGRIDGQVKVRGHRIELGEIEVALQSHAAVGQATVVVREDAPGDHRITAYVVRSSPEHSPAPDLRAFLKTRLPEPMVPSAVVWLDKLPINANGKVDRLALPAPVGEGHGPDATPAGERERLVAAAWRDVLGVPGVGVDENFFDLGGHSLLIVQLQQKLVQALGRDVSVVELFQFPTIRSLVEHLDEGQAEPQPAAGVRPIPPVTQDGPIAIVGMAGRFPGAADVATLWRNLLDGVEAISHFTDGDLAAAKVDPGLIRNPSYVKARGVLQGADEFDAGLFGYTPREAEVIDPQQRVFLECAWEALESAGCDPETFPGRIGVFAGTGFNTYLPTVAAQPGALDALGGVQLALAADKDFLATRVAYKLNLRGPALAVQTACSTSLVAVHLACQSLRARDCDVVLAGGVRIAFPQVAGYLYQDGSIMSPDGHCRAFDAAAQGTVSGSGAAIVVLKRLDDAIAAGDTIHVVIRGSAINNDGSQKVGFTAPGVDGQAAAIADAHRASGVDPSTIGYVEAHGTGTSLGDPVEIAALTAAFRQATDRVGFCALGSLKTNVGHLDAAAGAAGLIKAALAVEHGEVPPSLHFSSPNPAIDFAASPFVVADTRRAWPGGDGPRRAAVSSFGLGGTNAHVVLEQAPKAASDPPARESQLLVLSAATPTALAAAASRLSAALREQPDANLPDIAYTLQVGRRALPYRRAVACRSMADAIAALEAPEPAARQSGGAASRRGVAFMFSGQGSQHVGMARGTYEAEPVFRDHMDACARMLAPHLGFDLRTVLYPEADASADAARRLEATAVTQPALFAVEYALARLWMSWGVRPEAMIGHSIGEYVAACLAGVFSLEDALSLVAARGRLMQAMEAGDMLAVPLAESDVSPLLSDGISIAAVNSPAQVVLSGTREAVAGVARALEARGVEGRVLRTSHAFHSGMMDPMLGAFAAEVARVRLSPPRLPYVSNVTGTWIGADEATSPEYWVRHLRGTVRFAEGLQALVADADRVLLEVGPGRSLTALARRAGAGRTLTAVPSLPRVDDITDDAAAVIGNLGTLWCAGVAVDWNGLHAGERRRRVPLPTYPFERRRYWLGDGTAAASAGTAADGRQPMDRWLYAPGWMQAPRPAARAERPSDRRWLVFEDEAGVGAGVTTRARALGLDVVTVVAGETFEALGPDGWALNPDRADDYHELWSALELAGRVPDRVVHCWGVSTRAAAFDREQALGLFSVCHLLDARSAGSDSRPLEVAVVTSGVRDVTGTEPLRPATATALAACKVAPHEYRGLACRAIDVEPSAGAGARVVDELLSTAVEQEVAYRGGRRWVPVYNRLIVSDTGPSRVRDGGVYLITGGLGGVGLEIATVLARDHRASLALVGRRELPARELWQDWLSSREADDEVSRVLRRLLALEQGGSRVVLLRADVADEAQCRDAVRRTIGEFGALHGVVHAAGADKGPVPMSQVSAADWAAQFAPRVHGVQALERALEGVALDFCLMHSSLASVLGVVGHCAYTAAHLYMDAFVADHNRRSAVRWTAVDWDNWLTWKSGAAGRGATDLVMTADEGTEALDRILRAGDDVSHVVVSTGDLDARRRRWTRAHEAFEAPAPGPGHARPALSSEFAAPRTDRERVLCGLWERLLGISPIGVDDNFFELGGDSVVGIQVVAQASAAGLRLSARHLFEHPTVAGLARVAQAVDGAGRDDRPIDGPAPLTPIQQWFFDQDLRTPQHFNQARLLEVRHAVPASVVERALSAVVAHHEGLRLRFERDGDGWRQVAGSPAGALTFEAVDLSGKSPEARERLMEESAEAMCRSFDLEAGPLLGARLFDPGGGQRTRLLVAAHHLLVDVSSWRILIEDLETACGALAAGQTPQLPRSTTPFTRWARHLARWAGSGEAAAEAAFWERQVSAATAVLPRDMPGGENTEGSRAIVERALGSGATDRLLRTRAGRGSLAVHALTAALASSCLEWSGGQTLRIDFEGHGRESVVPEADLSRTIGWFTSIYPLTVTAGGTAPGAQLDRVREQLDAVPNGGIGYGALRYLADREAAVRLSPGAATEVSFLYVGRQDARPPAASLFAPLPSQLGAVRDPEARRGYVLEFTAYVFDGKLHLQLAYSRNLHQSATIERLAARVVEMLDLLTSDEPVAPGANELSAAHFPGARLNQQQMDNLVSKLRRPGRTTR